MSVARQAATATLLDDGTVLVVGGSDGTNTLASAEIYDPCTGTWSSAGTLTYARFASVAVLLPGGDVLVAGRLFAGWRIPILPRYRSLSSQLE
jgi:sugar (pentulose or hexulose) kinase